MKVTAALSFSLFLGISACGLDVPDPIFGRREANLRSRPGCGPVAGIYQGFCQGVPDGAASAIQMTLAQASCTRFDINGNTAFLLEGPRQVSRAGMSVTTSAQWTGDRGRLVLEESWGQDGKRLYKTYTFTPVSQEVLVVTGQQDDSSQKTQLSTCQLSLQD